MLLYYSFTEQTNRAIAQAAAACAAQGWQAVTCRLDIADPAERLVRPLSVALAKKWTKGAQDGMILPIVYDPADAVDDAYDLVLLFTNTWGGAPSVPVRSFLQSEKAKHLLDGHKFAVIVICRRVWEKNYNLVRELGEAAGGNCIGGERFTHAGGQIGSLLQTVTYLFRTDGGRRSFLGMKLPAYGLSPKTLASVKPAIVALLQKAVTG